MITRKKLIWLIPVGIVGMAAFIALGGFIVQQLWNWLAPALLGLRLITFWQALALLILCRILFGGFGFHDSGNKSRRRRHDHASDRWEALTPEERDRFRRSGGPAPGESPAQ